MKNTLHVTTPSDREILMTRVFDAPRPLVWETMSEPELLKRWLFGPPGWSMVVCDDDPRVGGTFRWVWRGPDGAEMAMRGVYREIVPPERCVRTESMEFGCAPQAGEQLATLVLTEQGTKTLLTLRVLFPSKEARDAAIASGMDRGVAAGYDRLETILASVAQGVPSGFKTAITATLSVRNWARAVDFYKAAFGAAELYRVPGGGVAELAVEGAAFWVAEESPEHLNFSPEHLGGCSVRVLLIVADPAAVCAQAVAAGATQVAAVADAHGWRIGRIVDPFGHHWEIARQLKSGSEP
jgi:uncharacterized protein YndB with AHSA1/START domain/uncharacterized glyoxalase superfamily protein PhnB